MQSSLDEQIRRDEETLCNVIRDAILGAVTIHERFGTNFQDELYRAVYELLRAGAGPERIMRAAAGISAAIHGEVCSAVEEVLYGPKRKFERPLSDIEIEDPQLIIAHIDAGVHPNPGDGACAAVLYSQNKPIHTARRELSSVTSNEAEYHGAILALESALDLGYRRIEVRSDSKLLVEQLNGRYRLNAQNLIPLVDRIRELMRSFNYVRFVHVPREQNTQAHDLVHHGA